MEIPSIFIQTRASHGFDSLFTAVSAVTAAMLLVSLLRRIDWRRRLLPDLGSMSYLRLSLAAVPLVPIVSGPPRGLGHNDSPQLETSGFPPPRLLVRAEASAHPAIHSRPLRTADAPLFPRATSQPEVIQRPRHARGLEPRELAAVRRGVIDLRRMQRSTRSRQQAAATGRSHHAVLPGDTLWDIAAEALGTDDVRKIARYWPMIHRENRDIIGSDPNLIRPGMVLTLPRVESA